MQLRRYKRFFLVLMIAFLCNDFISQRKLEPMAVAFPAVQQVVLSAQAVFALVSAATYIAKVQVEKWYHQPSGEHKHVCQAKVQEVAPSLSVSPVAPQSSPKTYTFKKFDLQDFVVQVVEQQLSAPLSPVQKKEVEAFVANPFKEGCAPINFVYFDSSPYHAPQAGRLLMGPDFMRVEYGNDTHRLYGQVSYHQQTHLRGPTAQELEEHRLLSRYEDNPVYRQEIYEQRKQEIKILIKAAIDSSAFGKIAALKTFFATRLKAPFNTELQKIRYWLAPLFFDHKTGELSLQPKSTAEALQPIVEYFKHAYGDQWYQELGSYIDLQEFHLLIDSVDYKGWEWAVHKVYAWFYSTFYLQWLNLAKKVVGNTTNQKIMALVETSQMQDFGTAKRIAQDARSKAADEIFAYFYNQKFDAYGMRRELAKSPEWANLPDSVKQEIRKLPNGITLFSNYLALRAQEKTRQEIAQEEQVRPCGTGSIKEQEVEKASCVVSNEELEQKGSCVQGEQEVSLTKPCDVTKEQEPKSGCNYGTQVQSALLSENAQEQERNKVVPEVPEENPSQSEKQKGRPEKSEERQRRESDVKRARERLEVVIGINGQPHIDVDTHGQKVIEFLKEGTTKGISKDLIDAVIEALEKFKDVEGFLDENGPVHKILLECMVDIAHQSTVNGAGYEVEVALRESRHSKVIRFGEKVQVPGIGKRDIDLETEDKLIECKNTLWSEKEVEKIFNYKQAREKISQIKKKPFEVASKGPIPEQLKKWLIKNFVPYSEGL